MTRFARASGSKSSNERVPEEATSWSDMKKQLEERKQAQEVEIQRKEFDKKRRENYEKFLQERKEENSKSSWATFPEMEVKKKKIENENKNEKKQARTTDSNGGKKKLKCLKDVELIKKTYQPNELLEKKSVVLEVTKPPKKKKLKNKKEKKEDTTPKKQKNSKQKISPDIEPPKKKEKSKPRSDKNTPKQKPKPPVDKYEDKPYKNLHFNEHFVEINGERHKISQYEGFAVKEEDALRLRELKKQMKLKGIPKSEIQSTLKLERRKAEKALTRAKKKVCFNCRKSGHLLADCPETRGIVETTGTGICYKCGSTEHTHFECRVVRDNKFAYAQCFICKENGHISRQCPDNPRGLYPQGGGCRLCGDVEHLRKDCPTLKNVKEQSEITLDTWPSRRSLDSL